MKPDIGENPAQFLDYDFVENDGMRELALARIRGIDRIAAVRAWIGVERALGRPARDRIIRALQDRGATLREVPTRLTGGRHSL